MNRIEAATNEMLNVLNEFDALHLEHESVIQVDLPCGPIEYRINAKCLKIRQTQILTALSGCLQAVKTYKEVFRITSDSQDNLNVIVEDKQLFWTIFYHLKELYVKIKTS